MKEKIDLLNAVRLDKNEMKNVKGGKNDYHRYHCICNEIPGEWEGTYTSEKAKYKIGIYCGEGGGRCTTIS